MSFPQQLFLAFTVVGFLGLSAALIYAWILTEGWKPSNQSPAQPVSAAPHAEQTELLAKAA
jgi:hypothetical protein